MSWKRRLSLSWGERHARRLKLHQPFRETTIAVADAEEDLGVLRKKGDELMEDYLDLKMNIDSTGVQDIKFGEDGQNEMKAELEPQVGERHARLHHIYQTVKETTAAIANAEEYLDVLRKKGDEAMEKYLDLKMQGDDPGGQS